MIGKNEQVDDDNTRVRIISEKKKLLQDTSAKVQEEVRLCFEQLAKVLRTRERQLLRQVQAVHNQQSSMLQTNWELLPSIPSVKINLSKQQDLEDSILEFGELLSSDRKSIAVSDAEPYKIEEYVEANRDHISFDKSIKLDREEETTVDTAERFDSFQDSSCELSFNVSSDADTTFENEITVLMNHNYSSESDGLRDSRVLPELLAETKSTEVSADKSKENFVEDSLYSRDIAVNNYTPELKISDKNFRMRRDCAVPEEKENSIVEKLDSFAKENDETSLTNGEKNLCGSADSGSPAEILEKSGDIPMNKRTRESEEHPKQIQQWLQQILVETETEPTIHEIEQFAEISKSRFKEFQFPLET